MKPNFVLSRRAAINVAHIVERSRVVGPGERCIIWVQGCPLRCPGCVNPQFRRRQDATWVDVDVLAEAILRLPDLEGVTYTGGEPFAQAEALAALSRWLRPAGLSVLTYSGFTLAQLRAEVMPHARDLLDEIDLLVDGPFLRNLPTARPWRGSDNQRLIALTDRYRNRVAEWDQPTGGQFEVRFGANGAVEILGFPSWKLLTRREAFRPGRSRIGDQFRGGQHKRSP